MIIDYSPIQLHREMVDHRNRIMLHRSDESFDMANLVDSMENVQNQHRIALALNRLYFYKYMDKIELIKL